MPLSLNSIVQWGQNNLAGILEGNIHWAFTSGTKQYYSFLGRGGWIGQNRGGQVSGNFAGDSAVTNCAHVESSLPGDRKDGYKK